MLADESGRLASPEAQATHAPHCIFRRAESDELGRAASLCTPAPARPGEGRLHCFVAVRSQPIERLLAVAFWRSIPEPDGTHTAEIRWTALPALGAEVSAFLRALIAQIPTQEPSVTTLAAADWLTANHASAALLEELGFSAAATRTFFQADAVAWRTALAAGTEETPAAEQASIHPPQGNHLAALRPLLGGTGLRPSELAHGFQSAATTRPSLFDPRCSGLILTAGEPTAVCLAQHAHGHLTLAALVGTPSCCRALLHHALQAHDHLPEPTTLSFHLDDGDSPSSLATLLDSLPHHPAAKLSRYTHPVSPTKQNDHKVTTPK